MTTVETTVSYSVSEAAEAVGLSTYTLRWYEQEGLVEPIGRDSAGRRRYNAGDIGFLGLLTKLRGTGMSVADMRRYAELVRSGTGTYDARLELLEGHRDRVLERIDALKRDLEAVDFKISMYRAYQCQEQSS
ncbi:MerR family transcriptional regulator [Hamadaea tsunoensis]|uniref:MerR family transcriptional regulator n=1 Tax=Hamadaea tsunoensis TaxID=53368 RepID=UPI000409B60D|nr:MerR family transcriptional regulator [Hamadaea tsunoensis]